MTDTEDKPLANVIAWDDDQFENGVLSVRYGLAQEVMRYDGVIGDTVDTQIYAEEVGENEYRATVNIYAWALFPAQNKQGLKSFARFLINDHHTYEFNGAGVTFDLGNSRLVRDGELVVEVGDELIISADSGSVPAVRGDDPGQDYLERMENIGLTTDEIRKADWSQPFALLTISSIAPIMDDVIVERQFDDVFGLKDMRKRNEQ